MDNLLPETPLHGWSLEIGKITACEKVSARVTSIQPLQGQHLNLPAPGTWQPKEEGLILWTGLDEWFALDCTPPKTAYLTDQSDGWAWVSLTGPDWADVLARLCPLAPGLLQPGVSLRSDLAHMSAILYGIETGIVIGVMRSFAGSLQHALEVAAHSVAAQKPVSS